MSLSRKHYIELAAILRPHVECGELSQEALNDLERWLMQDNGRFDWRRFEEACGVQS